MRNNCDQRGGASIFISNGCCWCCDGEEDAQTFLSSNCHLAGWRVYYPRGRIFGGRGKEQQQQKHKIVVTKCPREGASAI